jgi:hypothetical protein
MIGITLALALLAQNPQQWIYVGMSGGENRSMHGLDRGNITTLPNGRKRFWSMSVFEEPDMGYDSAIGFQEIDCAERSIRTLQGNFYKSATGDSFRSQESPRASFITPGTIDEAQAEIICNGAHMTDDGVESPTAFETVARITMRRNPD